MAIILFPKSASVVESAGQILGTARIIQLFIVVLSLAKIKNCIMEMRESLTLFAA